MAEGVRGPGRWVRDYVFDVLRDLDINYIFGVPGTNEIPIIDGTSFPENGCQYVECLHENIAIGAAMGYAQISGKPGVLVVHVTPGIGHSIGNLFNAWRSRIPLVILCCQQQNDLVTQEPLLASNLVELARQYTKWAHEVRAPDEVPLVLQRAFKEAMAPPSGPVFVAIPWEFTIRSIGDEDRAPGVTRIPHSFTGDRSAVEQAASILSGSRRPLIVAGDGVGYADAWPEMQELALLLGAPVLLQSFSSVANYPNDDPHWQGELPGSQDGMRAVFGAHDVAFLCGFGAQAQVTVFKYSDGPLIPRDVRQIYMGNNTWDIGKNYFGEAAILGDIKATLPMLNELVRRNPPEGASGRNDELNLLADQRRREWDGYLSRALAEKEIWAVVIADALRGAIIRRGLAKKFVYVHEAVSDPAPFQYLLPLGTAGSAPVSYYCVAGGSLGWSMPATLGIKLGNGGRQGVGTDLVVNAVGDGSSLFYPQTWWTAAHRQLSALYIITNNREYRTLQLGVAQVVNAYGKAPGYGWHPCTTNPDYLRIDRPQLDFVALAGVLGGHRGETVTHPGQVAEAIDRGVDHVLGDKGSYVLDMRTAEDTPSPPPSLTEVEASARYAAQPRLDLFHAGATGLNPEVPTDIPLIF